MIIRWVSSSFPLWLLFVLLPLRSDMPDRKLTSDEEEAKRIAEMGKPVLGEHSKLEVIIEESYEFKVGKVHLQTEQTQPVFAWQIQLKLMFSMLSNRKQIILTSQLSACMKEQLHISNFRGVMLLFRGIPTHIDAFLKASPYLFLVCGFIMHQRFSAACN